MKKTNSKSLIDENRNPESTKEIKINHSKGYYKANKELSAYLNKLPITKDQSTELLILMAKLSIISEIDAYTQGLGDGFDKGADCVQKYIDGKCKENAEKYDVLIRKKI